MLISVAQFRHVHRDASLQGSSNSKSMMAKTKYFS